jgi:hypothetical protein
MWRTLYGERTLKGAEAILFSEGLLSLLDEAAAEEPGFYDLGVECFDNLTFGQKVSVLSIIGRGLLCEDIPLVRLSAVLEGAIAAVFEYIKDEITFEIDRPKFHSYWRSLVAAAAMQIGAMHIPEVTCTDLHEWETEVDGLAKAILWYLEYDDAGLYIDLPPEKSKQLRDWVGIPDDYFMAIADDLSDAEAREKIKELKILCKSIVHLP